MAARHDPPSPDTLRAKLHEVIFEADTPLGKAFDVGLLIAIILAVVVVLLESVPSISKRHHDALVLIEWFFTALFTALLAPPLMYSA